MINQETNETKMSATTPITELQQKINYYSALENYRSFKKNVKEIDDEETRAYWYCGEYIAYERKEFVERIDTGIFGTINIHYANKIAELQITYIYPIKYEFFEHMKEQYENNMKYAKNYKRERQQKLILLKEKQEELSIYLKKHPTKKQPNITRAYKARYLAYYLKKEGKSLTNLNKATEDKLDLLIAKHVVDYTIEQYEEETYEGTPQEKRLKEKIKDLLNDCENHIPTCIKNCYESKCGSADILLKYNKAYYIVVGDRKKSRLELKYRL